MPHAVDTPSTHTDNVQNTQEHTLSTQDTATNITQSQTTQYSTKTTAGGKSKKTSVRGNKKGVPSEIGKTYARSLILSQPTHTGSLRRTVSLKNAQAAARQTSVDDLRQIADVSMLDDTLPSPAKERLSSSQPSLPPKPTQVETDYTLDSAPGPQPAFARRDAYSIVISNTPAAEQDPEEEGAAIPHPDVLDDWNWDGVSTGSQWTDVDSQATGRASLLPPIGKRSGVSKDLATERARDLLMTGKEALESSKTLKRELRATTVECLNNLYELVLSLSDSRQRHRLNLEIEKSRAARELVRVERAHHEEIRKLRKEFDERLQNTQEALRETHRMVEGIQGWLNSEVGGLISTVKAFRREAREPGPRALPPPQQTTTAQTPTEEYTRELKEISAKITSLATEIHYLQQDRVPTRQGSPTSQSPKTPNQEDPLKASLESLREEMEASRKEIARIRQGISDLKNKNREEVREELTTATAPIQNKTTKLLEEIGEVKDIVLANCGLHTSGATGLGTELAITDTTAKIEGILNPLKAEVAEIASTSRALNSKIERLEHPQPPTTSAKVQKPKSYAETLKTRPSPKPNHTLIVSSTDPSKTGDKVIDTIRTTLDLKNSGLRVDRVRKAKNSKVILSCASREDAQLLQNKIKSNQGLKVTEAKTSNPLIVIKNLLSYHTDEDICQHLRAQNKKLFEGLSGDDKTLKVRYRKRARNDLQCHPVMEVAPKLHKRILEQGHVHIGLEKRTVEDQSPLIQCAKCLGFGHTKALCKEKEQACNYCGDIHSWQDCPVRKQGGPPKCRNCTKAQKGATHNTNTSHLAFSDECPEKAIWDGIARSKIAYC